MSLALLANTDPRIVAILNAAPGTAWASSVSGQVGAFPSQSEITAASLEADGILINEGYFNSVNNTLAQPFMTPTAALAKGQKIPQHRGNIGRVEVARSVKTFTTGGVNTSTDVITTSANHGFRLGEPISFFGPSGVPGGLTADQTYYAIPAVTQTQFQVATSVANAIAGTYVDLTSIGAGTMTVVAWQGGVEAKHVDDVKQAIELADTYVETGALNYIWKMDQGVIWHASDYARVEIPSYTRTTALQANREDEPIIIAIAIKLLTKHASPAAFKDWAVIADEGLQSIIRDGSYQPRGGQEDQNP